MNCRHNYSNLPRVQPAMSFAKRMPRGRPEKYQTISYMNSQTDNDLIDQEITCLMLHPVGFPNHGAVLEQSLASEALGLVRSLDWEIYKGPRGEQEEDDPETEELRQDIEGGGGR